MGKCKSENAKCKFKNANCKLKNENWKSNSKLENQIQKPEKVNG
jgi:hypothetical protein